MNRSVLALSAFYSEGYAMPETNDFLFKYS